MFALLLLKLNPLPINSKKAHNILETDQLSIGYGEKEVASEISLAIRPAQLIAVIGINGSGKSTLLKTLTGELKPLSGSIQLRQKDLATLSPKAIAKAISLVLTNTHFSLNLSVEELVALGRHPYTNWLGVLSEEDKKAVQQALKTIEVEDLAARKCSDLSDGQLQKVMLARALAQDTPLIILDEPTNHLDLYHKVFVFQLLKKLTQQTQKTIVFASHEINLALQLCDQIILINQGKVIQDSPQNLIESGHLDSLFPEDMVKFDPESKSFQVIG